MTYKGNLDIELAIDALTSANRYDICLLVSGDGDFVPLIRSLTMLGKIVQVVSTPGSVAMETRSEVGLDFQDLQDIRSHIEKKERPSAPSITRTTPRAIPPTAPVTAPPVQTPSPAPGTISVGQEFDAKVASIYKGGANLSNPWNVNAFLPISGLGIRGFVEDATTLLSPGDTLHVVVTEMDTSSDPCSVRVELADSVACDALQRKYDASRTPADQVPDCGEHELTVGPVKQYGAFLKNPWNAKILLHVSKLGLTDYIPDCFGLFRRDERLRVRVTKKEIRGNEVLLSVELADEEYRDLLRQRLAEASAGEEP
jgi:predicted RNA-binding protein with RPS1 domain